jgi:RNA polymerase sigma-70 factor (ECF subfamily)
LRSNGDPLARLLVVDEKTEAFLRLEPRLFGIAYRMLGSRAEAEDTVQDTYLKWHQAQPGALRSSEAFLVTLATRASIDRLRRLRTQRADYFGPWLPEPLAEADYATPQWQLELADDVSIAFLAVLEKLSPEERAVFLLREVFDFEYAEIAAILSKSEAACRKMHSRSKERVKSDRPRFAVPEDAHRRLLESFARAAKAGDRDELVRLLAHEATLSADGGGKAPAVFKVLRGSDRIIRFFAAIAGLLARRNTTLTYRPVRINGEPGLLRFLNGKLHSAMTIETDGERILAVYIVANPEKLERFLLAVATDAEAHHRA